jgi:DNA-binding IclR family transcriptional regulator
MTHTYEELRDMTVAQMRDLAQGVEHEAVSGYSTMHKEQLLGALCTALGIEAHVHHEVVGIDKASIKAQIRALKLERQSALDAGDSAQLKRVRRKIHRLKRKIRRATV